MADEGRRRVLDAFARALRRELHVLADRHDLLWQQLYNRLQWDVGPVVDDQRTIRADASSQPWVWVHTPYAESIALERTLAGHADAVNACAYSPDGRFVASAADDHTVKVWDAGSGACLRTLVGHAEPVRACAFSPDGQRIVSASEDMSLKVWDANTGGELRTFEHRNRVNACAFSPDGRWIVSAGGTETLHYDFTIHVWDADSGSQCDPLHGHMGLVSTLAFSPDGRRLVSASADETLRVWDAERFTPTRPWWTRLLARILRRDSDTENGPEIHILRGHIGLVNTCAFSADGRRIVSADPIEDRLKVWDADSGVCLETLSPVDSVWGCAFSPDGRWMVSASVAGVLEIWDVESWDRVATLEGHASAVNGCAFSPDGRHIVSASWDHTLKVWDADRFDELGSEGAAPDWVTACTYSPDGQRIASVSAEGTLTIWDDDNGSRLAASKVVTSLRGCVYTPDGEEIVSAGIDDGTFRVYDGRTGEEVPNPMRGERDIGINGCALSVDGRWIVSASNDGILKVWDVNSGFAVQSLSVNYHRGPVNACAFSPDGRSIVSASEDKTLKVWEIRHNYDYYRVALTPLVARPVRTLKGHTKSVVDCGFSPDGRWIVSASQDKTLMIWDATREDEARTLEGHTGAVRACTYSPDGRWILSVGDDKTLRVWEAASGDPVMVVHLVYPLRAVAAHPRLPRVALGDETGALYRAELKGIEYGSL